MCACIERRQGGCKPQQLTAHFSQHKREKEVAKSHSCEPAAIKDLRGEEQK